MSFEYNEVFLQESCIGFANGAFFKTALICNIDNEGSSVQGKDVEMIEESKRPQLVEQKRLQDANITRLETIMKKEQMKPIKVKRLFPKNITMSSYCQIEVTTSNGKK